MFSISTKGDYGLLLLSALAMEHKKGAYMSLRKIADEKKLSLKYLSEIAHMLKEAGIITSKEGRDGGYVLAKAPESVRLIEVLEVLEGPVEPVKCCSKVKVCACESSCGVKTTWKQAAALMKEFLGSKTLADTITNSR